MYLISSTLKEVSIPEVSVSKKKIKKKGLKTVIKVGDRKSCLDSLGVNASTHLIEFLNLHQARLRNMREMGAVRKMLYESLKGEE